MNIIQGTTIREVSEWCDEAGVDAVSFLGALFAGCQDATDVFLGIAVGSVKRCECGFDLPDGHAAFSMPVASEAAAGDARRVSNFGLRDIQQAGALA